MKKQIKNILIRWGSILVLIGYMCFLKWLGVNVIAGAFFEGDTGEGTVQSFIYGMLLIPLSVLVITFIGVTLYDSRHSIKESVIEKIMWFAGK